ncbi:long-chain fatty acid--CoA ligase [Terasakiella sp. A23]|uniref:long-chain-fatty-acid--CoA ligase n=1 Tax=Terasakiella sp. FCG-A23 TaxID=3080561 RepID=UPI0029553308|nr:long-chain fatty acid--CoA ligase [Terasakiella sp. A23]MDV7338714.1 long-chain fatty acid--CoA ligase [Terasakiella sp. A23]
MTKPWLSSYADNVPHEINVDPRPLHAFFEDAVINFGDHGCLDFLDKKYTYAEIGDLVGRAAKGFQLLGVKAGVKVGLCLPNCPYYVICYYAILTAGGTVVNYNPLYVRKELEFQAQDSETEIMVTLDLKQLYPKVTHLMEAADVKKVVVCSMTDILPPVKSVLFNIFKRSELTKFDHDLQHYSFDQLIQNDGLPDPVEIDPDHDIAVIQYTGGTTGVPKGAVLTHANLVANLRQVRGWLCDLTPGQERMLCVLPFFHVFAMTVVLNLGIASGMELIMVPRFELDEVLDLINEKKPTLFPAVPTIYNAISQHPKIRDYDLTSIRYCISGGAPLPLKTRTEFEELTGCSLVEGYGLSECSPVATCNPIGGVSKEGSIGIPLPSTQIIVRDMMPPYEAVEPGKKGEICIIGPQVMKGYYHRIGATEATFHHKSLKTGDIGYMDGDGYIFLVDRAKDLILCGGYNVYPRHVEEAIMQHRDVAEVTVIGIEDEYRGQAPKAFVKLKEGCKLREAELKAFLHEYLSPIERPSEIEFRDELPKTMIGKLSKKELLAEEVAKKKNFMPKKEESHFD